MKKLFVHMLTVKNTFKLLDVINKHFHNEHDSRLFITEVEEIMDNKVDLKMNDFATRKDLAEHHAATKQDYTQLKAELKHDYTELKAELKQDITELTAELKQNITELRAELKQDITELRAEVKKDITELRVEFRTDFNRLDASVNLHLANSAILLERSLKDHTKWMVGLMITLLSLAVAIIKLT